MLKMFANAWRVEAIRNKLLFTLLLLFIYRIGAVLVPLPGLDLQVLNQHRYFYDPFDAAMTFFALLMGGEIGTVFAMGIAPYITSSIIMQLLTYAIPALNKMQKEDEKGREKIQQITRYLAVGLAALQASGMVFSYTRFGADRGFVVTVNLFAEQHQNLFVYFVAVVAMMTGTIFIMWLAELLTEKGIGNGASFLIFANILAQLPAGLMTFWAMVSAEWDILQIALVVILLIVFILIIAFTVWVHEGERRIPIQNSRKSSARGMYGNNHSFIPLKVNIAGVLSIIFAMSLISFPVQIAQFFPNATFINNVASFVDFRNLHWIGAILYVVLIFAFTHFYTSFAVNPIEMAENLKHSGSTIPGIRTGAPTARFIQTTVNRLAWIGAVFYSIIALTPILLGRLVPEIAAIAFGGTSLLIVAGVALEFVKQLETQLRERHLHLEGPLSRSS